LLLLLVDLHTTIFIHFFNYERIFKVNMHGTQVGVAYKIVPSSDQLIKL
jgi:hypothetical protein